MHKKITFRNPALPVMHIVTAMLFNRRKYYFKINSKYIFHNSNLETDTVKHRKLYIITLEKSHLNSFLILAEQNKFVNNRIVQKKIYYFSL